MQIDFHHTVTYVLARLAGFPQTEAGVIAYSAQYVDDAVNAGTIKFRNKALYSRISSAHKMLDYRNFRELGNHRVWIPFHFLPGNQGKPAGENPDASFVEKIVCIPDSHVAKDMLSTCIADHAKPYALHRLGISMHVYADTWAHQKFAGINHEINQVKDMSTRSGKKDKSWLERLRDYFGDKVDEVTGERVSGALPLGHGGALSKPDMPFLEEWGYTNGMGEPIKRKNFLEFVEAAQAMFRAMKNFQNQDPQLGSTAKIPTADLKQIKANFKKFTDEDGCDRHEKWLNSIAAGDFSFGAEELTYVAKGRGSWKYQALDTTKEIENGRERYKFKSMFLHSNWKLFHDALQAHRFDVLHDILPRYGISAA
jgi:hypothetical protein